jgi:hypothetical protein
MAVVSKAFVEEYGSRLDAIGEMAAAYARNATYEWFSTQDVAKMPAGRLYSHVVTTLYECFETYGPVATELANVCFDATMRGMGQDQQSVGRYIADRESIQGIASYVVRMWKQEHDVRGVADRTATQSRDEMHRAANRATVENVANANANGADVRYARVLSGLENCTWCTMLASRGFVYTSEENAAKTHSNCDCRIIAGPRGAQVEGYDLQAAYDRWKRFEEIDADDTLGRKAKTAAKVAYAEENPVWLEDQADS